MRRFVFDQSRWVAGLSLIFWLSVALPAQASEIAPWAGASATASYDGGSHNQTGATANASINWSSSTGPYNSLSGSGQFHLGGSGTSSASAGSSAASLLTIQTNATGWDPGSTGGLGGSVGQSTASASWTGDSIQLTTAPGAAFPTEIRLNLNFTFDTSTLGYLSYGRGTPDWNFGSISATANDTSINVRMASPSFYNSDGLVPANPGYEVSAFDNLKDSGNGFKTGQFHIDLPVDSSGKTVPITLMLEAMSNASVTSNTGSWESHAATLGIASVTTTDGTSLSSLGYGVSFASGIIDTPQPAPVPEPASVAVWSIAAVVGLAFARKRHNARD